MNMQHSTSWDTGQAEQAAAILGEGRSEEDHVRRNELAARVSSVAQRNGWSKKETASRIGMPQGTFSQWLSGKYTGRYDNQNEMVAVWLENVDDMQAIALQIPASPNYIQTSTSQELIDLLGVSQMMAELVIGTYGSGMGKTFTAEQYRATHANCWIATMTPYTKTVHGMLQTVSASVGLKGVGGGQIVHAIGQKIKLRNAPTLLIIDESQNLIDDAVNQLRHFGDDYKCGIALIGNAEFYARFKNGWADNEKYAQIRSRVFKRIRRDKPVLADLHKFIKAHGITDAAQVKFLTGVGMKQGAFRQVNNTVKLAKMIAAGHGRELQYDDLKRAWTNRDVEV